MLTSVKPSRPLARGGTVKSWAHGRVSSSAQTACGKRRIALHTRRLQGKAGTVAAAKQDQDEELANPEKTTEKYGLEYGLFKTLTDKSKSEKEKKLGAKGLLAKYGSAYLLTSISFALVSFGLCYFLVSAGIDVGALLGKLGLHVSTTSERVGKFAIAYAAHKAASPIRFPPTVALTPVVAQLMGKSKEETEDTEKKEE